MSEETQIERQPAPEPDGWEWMLVEIMGHREHWGRTREEERFGAKMLRIDIPIKGEPSVHGWATRYYGGPAIFSITLTDEATVMAHNKPWDAPSRMRLAAPEPSLEIDPAGFRGDDVAAGREEDDLDNDEGA